MSNVFGTLVGVLRVANTSAAGRLRSLINFGGSGYIQGTQETNISQALILIKAVIVSPDPPIVDPTVGEFASILS